MIYALVFNKISRKASCKQSTAPIESEAFRKCDPSEESLGISHTILQISQIVLKIRNTISTVVGLCKVNSDNSHGLTKIDYLLSKKYFLRKEIPEKNLVIKEFVSINKKYANKNTPDSDKHGNVT